MAELLNSLHSDVVMGMAQAAAAIVLCLVVVVLCRWFAVHVERETALSLARGLIQMMAVGIVLALLLHGSLLIGVLILLAMTFAAVHHRVAAGPGHQRLAVALLLSDRHRVRRRDCRHARHQNTHLGHCGPRACGQHDNCQRNECLRAVNGARPGDFRIGHRRLRHIH